MHRRVFLGLAAGAAACSRPATEKARSLQQFELEEATIANLTAGLQSGQWTSQDLVELYRRRIQDVDRAGPEIRAILELNPEADAIAKQLDQERAAGSVRGPLHGVPILIKDNIDTADEMMTTAGSLALEGWRPPVDAFVVQRLRAAGALILGKTNLSEWANFRSTRSTSGWSGRGGQTKNPYALNRNPSGSSSGSGAGVSANLCAAAVGTETDGSVVSPASINGIVGVKPTLGLVSRSGIIPIAHSQDTAGPMARTVADAAILLDAMKGADPNDTATAASANASTGGYFASLDATALRGARLGIVRSFVPNHAGAGSVLKQCEAVLRDAGAELSDVELAGAATLNPAEFEVLLYEFKTDLNAYLAKVTTGAPRSLTELIAFNDKNRDREMPWFGQEILEQAEKKGALTDNAYLQARATCLRIARTDGIDAVMAKNRLDAIVGMTDGPAWLTDPVNGDHYSGGSSTWAAVAGYPHITVPAGFVSGLPLGFSFMGGAWSERTLFPLAYAFEQLVKARRPPKFLVQAGG